MLKCVIEKRAHEDPGGKTGEISSVFAPLILTSVPAEPYTGSALRLSR